MQQKPILQILDNQATIKGENMETQKAGCFLVDLKTKQICLIYRDHHDDYTFPKGHIEIGEDAKTAAIRETAEETKRDAIIADEFAPYEEH